jgi:hypothetical protein
VRELSAIAEATESDVIAAADVFRRAGRSFVMPPASVKLGSTSILDLSHESLMRCWTRLIAWAEEERASAAFYVRLSRAAAWCAEGSAGLWRNPELELAQHWLKKNHPSAAWASRYDDGFERATTFLDRSLEQRSREEADGERERRTKLRRTQLAAGVLAGFLAIAVALTYYARRENARAETNLALAREAVDESLSAAERDPAMTGGDVPQVEEFRRELLTKAGRFYTAFMTQDPRSEKSRRDLAFAHFRLGHISRLLEKPDDAAREYQDSIERFEALRALYPENREYRAALANAYNWLGEAARPNPARVADAERAYNSAEVLQQELLAEAPSDQQAREDLARTRYNRGILRSGREGQASAADADFREAIRLLEPLAPANDRAAQELARAYNNLGSLLSADPQRVEAVEGLWRQAIAIDERLVVKDPGNRQYKMELALYCNNLAVLLHERGEVAEAERRNRQALDLLEAMSRVAPSLAVARADAHSLRGMILGAQDALGAEREYLAALDLFDQFHTDPDLQRLPDFHTRFGDLLVNLARFAGAEADIARARQLLARAAAVYADTAARLAASGAQADVEIAYDTLSRVIPELPEPERAMLSAASQQLQSKLNDVRGRR